jgi:iron complex outermembrane receptor protein
MIEDYYCSPHFRAYFRKRFRKFKVILSTDYQLISGISNFAIALYSIQILKLNIKMTNKYSLVRTGTLWLMAMLLSVCSWAQQRTVSGTVSSMAGDGPLPGVSVRVQGTAQGTVTNIDGQYSLQVPGDDAVLEFSFIGYTPETVTVGNRTTIDIALAEDIETLGEVIVVGYGTQEKRDLTGAVAAIGEEDFNQGAIVDPLQQINGRAAGVSINQVGSEPGQTPNIRIRGITSLRGGNDPLVVVDGIQGNLDLLKQIPPSEIKSFDILKDASSTAIYGSRGAAGVILITTKSGKAGQAQIEYNGAASVDVIARSYDVLSADEWREVANQRFSAVNDFGANTNWFDEITRNGYSQSHTLSLSGGTESFTYRASGTALLQEGIILGSESKNYIARFQGEQKAIGDKLTVGFNLNASFRNNEYNNGDRVNEALTRRPTDPIFAADANDLGEGGAAVGPYFIDRDVFDYINPVARTTEVVDGDQTEDMFGSLRLRYDIFDGLSATAFGSWRKVNIEYGRYQSALTTIAGARNIGDPTSVANIEDLPDGLAFRESKTNDEKLFNFILDYTKEIGKHNLNVVAVNEYQNFDYQGYSVAAEAFLIDNADNLNNLGAGDPDRAAADDKNSFRNDRTLSSFLGRLNYGYDDRYLASVSVRRDGASVFGANNKWGTFYSGSLAWRLSDENFFNVDFINDLKIRVGYGETGNQQGLDPLGSVLRATRRGTAYFGGQILPNFEIDQNANPDLRWETKKMVNAGLDFQMLQGRLTGSVDLFRGITENLLFQYDVPTPPFPVGNIFANAGEILNQGIEFNTNYTIIDNSDLTLNLGGNFSSIRTEVLELNGSIAEFELSGVNYSVLGTGGTTGVADGTNGINNLIIGQPLGVFYLYKHAGVDDTGRQIVDDLDGDGTIVASQRQSSDKYIAGQPLPKFNWAFTPSFRYKNLDANLVLRGAHGHKVFNARKAALSALDNIGFSNVLASAPEMGINNFEYATDLFLEDAGFARLENLTVGYNLNNIGAFANLRVSLTGTNLFVITDYTGIDPEVNITGEGGTGIDNGIYPRTRGFALGLNAKF